MNLKDTIRCFHRPQSNHQFISTKSEQNLNPQQSRHFSLLSEYIDEIQNISGSTNIVSDCLYRPPTDDASIIPASTSTVFIENGVLPPTASFQDTLFQQQMSEQYQHGTQMISIETSTLSSDTSNTPCAILPNNAVI